jgi:hypothetical protein
MQPAAAFVNYVYITKITQVTQLGIPLIVIISCVACEPVHSELDTHCLNPSPHRYLVYGAYNTSWFIWHLQNQKVADITVF